MQIALVSLMLCSVYAGVCVLAWWLFRRFGPRRSRRITPTAPGVHFSGAHDAGVPVDEEAFARIVRLYIREAAEPGDGGRG